MVICITHINLMGLYSQLIFDFLINTSSHIMNITLLPCPSTKDLLCELHMKVYQLEVVYFPGFF